MKRQLICVLFAIVLLIPAVTSAAQEKEFIVGSTADIIELCTAAPDDPVYTAAIHFCHGYLVGAYAYYRAANSGPEGDRLVCLPDPAPSRNAVADMYVKWAEAHPELMKESPVDSLFMFLTEQWPCKK